MNIEDMDKCFNLYTHSLNTVVEQLEDMNKRLKDLEIDLENRDFKKRMFKIMLTFYPIITIFILLLMTFDHSRMSIILTNIESILPFLL